MVGFGISGVPKVGSIIEIGIARTASVVAAA
jgi:hypothetical protein